MAQQTNVEVWNTYNYERSEVINAYNILGFENLKIREKLYYRYRANTDTLLCVMGVSSRIRKTRIKDKKSLIIDLRMSKDKETEVFNDTNIRKKE